MNKKKISGISIFLFILSVVLFLIITYTNISFGPAGKLVFLIIMLAPVVGFFLSFFGKKGSLRNWTIVLNGMATCTISFFYVGVIILSYVE
ncbi:hypothetical protein [Peribacillus simplex]|uniref:hypothetical protein n=1 Tax=Peribacillus simplex TaxID=1478 RepID=UPI003D2ACC74